jgi:hypothetical protein
VLDHQHGDAEVVLDVLDPERHVVGFLRIQAGGRLVEQQQPRLGGERARQLDHFAHAIGQTGDQAVAVVRQVEEIDHLLHRFALRQLRAAHARREQQLLPQRAATVAVATDEQVLQHGGVLEQLDVLERARDAELGDAVRRQPRQVVAVEPDAAAARRIDQADQVEDGRLARAIRADDGEHLARLQCERHAVDRPHAAEADAEVLDLKEGPPRGRMHRPRRPPCGLVDAHRRRSDLA